MDWLADEYLSVSIETLNKYGIKATIFATHDSALLRGLDPLNYEIGLHPNFTATCVKVGLAPKCSSLGKRQGQPRLAIDVVGWIHQIRISE